MPEVSVLLEREFAARGAPEGKMEPLPWYVVFALDRQLGSQTELVRQILQEKECRGFSLVALYDELRFLPKECAKVVELHGQDALLYDQDDLYGRQLPFTPDIAIGLLPGAGRKAGKHLPAYGGIEKGASRYADLLRMFGVGKAEHLNAITRWKEHDPTRTPGDRGRRR